MKQPNIIIIVADTMRLDALSVYNNKINTPAVDLFSRNSIIYNNAIAPAPWTIPSHASLFTGKYASEHKIHESEEIKIFDLNISMNYNKFPTIAEKLNKEGYNILGISANANIVPGSGFDKGFNNFYYSKNVYYNIIKNYLMRNNNIISADKIWTGQKKLEVLKTLLKEDGLNGLKRLYNLGSLFKNKYDGFYYDKGGYDTVDHIENSSFKSPFFLFLNFIEMHEPYIKDDPIGTVKGLKSLFGYININTKTKSNIRKRYFQRSIIFDYYFGRLIRFLKYNNIYDNTLIILTSDHGQQLYENNYYGHGIYLTDELIRIPLIIKYPGNMHSVDNDVISLTDLKDIILSDFSNLNDRPKYVFSESYGIHMDTRQIENLDGYAERKKDIDIRRKSIISSDYKMVMNQKGSIEELKYKGKKIDASDNREIATKLKEELDIFIGNEKFYS